MRIARRRLLQGLLGAAAGGGLAGAAAGRSARPRVVVAGAGFAGATAAKYLRMWGPDLEVTLVEPRPRFVSCPLSNLVIGGSRTLADLTMSYDALPDRWGVRLVRGSVTAIDPERHTVHLDDGTLPYERLVVAPGIDFIYETIPGLADPAARAAVPHAWRAGPQTLELRRRLREMDRGGVFIIHIPRMPYRCPPAPYERACQAAFLLKLSKPRAKVLVLDANPGIVTKRELFQEAWSERYARQIEYWPDQRLLDVDPKRGTLRTEFETYRGDVLNVIPPQRAGALAREAGLAGETGRWCEVDYLSYESTVHPHIHVIGDSVAGGLPKSAHMANAQAKVCAAAIVALTSGDPLVGAPVFANTCYSFVSAAEAMHISFMYRYDPEAHTMRAVPGGGHAPRASRMEAYYARAWASNIWDDTLG